MLIGIACRQNRMRSPFVVAVLSQFTRENLFSFGSNVMRGSRPSEIVLDLIAELGFNDEWRSAKELRSKCPQDVELHLSKSKLVLCLDESVFDELRVSLRAETATKLVLASGDETFLFAFDPINLSKDDTRLEVYKAALKSIQTLRKFKILDKNYIRAYLPIKESDSTQMAKQIISDSLETRKHFIISFDFYAPMGGLFRNLGLETRNINSISEISPQINAKFPNNIKGVFLGAQFELPWTYSDIFHELMEINRLKPKDALISLVLPNLDSSVRISAISMLGAWFADHVTVIGDSEPKFAKGALI